MEESPDLEGRLTQQEVEERLNDAVADLLVNPDVVKLKNFKQGLEICMKKGYDVIYYYDVYNGLVVKNLHLFEPPQPRRAKDINLEDEYFKNN